MDHPEAENPSSPVVSFSAGGQEYEISRVLAALVRDIGEVDERDCSWRGAVPSDREEREQWVRQEQASMFGLLSTMLRSLIRLFQDPTDAESRQQLRDGHYLVHYVLKEQEQNSGAKPGARTNLLMGMLRRIDVVPELIDALLNDRNVDPEPTLVEPVRTLLAYVETVTPSEEIAMNDQQRSALNALFGSGGRPEETT